MPRLRVTPREARLRAIKSQLASKSELIYGTKLTGKVFGRMFGLSEKTANNRRKDLDETKVKELQRYFDNVSASDADVLAWFGR